MAFNRPEWRPNPKQERFLSIPWTIKEAAYGGGAGSGKSDILLVYGICHRLHENPLFKQVFTRRTYVELKNEIVPRSRELYTKFGASFNKTEMAWTFPRLDQYGGTGTANGGAMIFLGHIENENDVHQYDSMEISLFTPDEITSYTEWMYMYIAFERVRAPRDSGLPSITRGAGMPGGIGHTWFKKRFPSAGPHGDIIINPRSGNKRIYIHSTQADNIDYVDPTYAQSLQEMPEAEKRAKLYGDWDAYLGQVFSEFRDRKITTEPQNALHVIPPFIVPDWWPKIVVIDWGFAAMNYVSFTAISPSGRVFTYREQSWLKTKIELWAPFVKYHIDNEKPRKVVICKSAGQNRGQEHTIHQQVSDALGVPVELSNNESGSRIAGKMLMHEYMRWEKKDVPESEKPIYNEQYAMWLYRNKGQQEYENYLKLFGPPVEELLPKWQIFCCDEENHDGHDNCCPLLINSIKACSYDKPKNNKPAEDVQEFEGDDPYDNARYMLDTVDQYVNESQEEFKKLQVQEALVAKLQNDQNFTAFYIQARANEGNTRIKAIQRYRRK